MDGIEADALSLFLNIPEISCHGELRKWLHLARVISPENDICDDILTYIRNGQEHGFGIRVTNIVEISRNGENEFDDQEGKFRMMLWHGTKTDCVANILQNGFKKPPAKGQMFGTGIYFADRASKSAQYCPPTQGASIPLSGSDGYLFLCDVILGKMFHSKTPRYDATSPPSYLDESGNEQQCDSVICTGKWIPNREEEKSTGHCVWPLGKTVENDRFDNYTVQYNEYIVYQPENVKPRYLVKVRFEDELCLYKPIIDNSLELCIPNNIFNNEEFLEATAPSFGNLPNESNIISMNYYQSYISGQGSVSIQFF